MSIILGIDPGSRVTGFAVIDTQFVKHTFVEAGCIRLSSASLSQKLYQLFSKIRELVEEFKPEFTAIETVFVSKNAQSALKLGQARGAIISALASYDLPVAEYSPREVKLALTGYGAAEKTQVQHMAFQLLNIEEKMSLDASDALAIALCHAHSYTSKQRWGRK